MKCGDRWQGCCRVDGFGGRGLLELVGSTQPPGSYPCPKSGLRRQIMACLSLAVLFERFDQIADCGQVLLQAAHENVVMVGPGDF